jgi:outer membrane protein OmpA-like peptidoglycan-associated protein
MKNLCRFFLVVFALVLTTTAIAQDENNPWQVSFGVNAIDVYPTNQPGYGGWFSEFYNVEDHWNILPSISTLSISRYVDGGFSVGLQGSLNSLDKLGDTEVEDISHYAVDASITYSLSQLLKLGKFDPFLSAGGGFTWLDDEGAGTFNGGLGLNYWLNDNIGLTYQTAYKHVFEDKGIPHFQHVAGISIKFGGKDSDSDGIYDKHDACPDEAGLPEFNGCPDNDGDGIENSKDSCPDEAGSVENNGCPDSDGDGVVDKEDACVNEAGLASLAGCPDSDGDGVADKDDACVNEAGPSANKGCPWKDTDGDSVLDKDDACVNEAGPVSNNGCPDIEGKLNTIGAVIPFDSEKSEITGTAKAIVDQAYEILAKYPSFNVSVEGHTDSRGPEAFNQKLSEARAAAVKGYLVQKGIASSRLTAVGYGESRPVASNMNKDGRKQNRRVEFKVSK